MESRPFKTRFAPSPTGLLHLGNVRTALFNYLLAGRTHGVFLLRLEDTDAMRGHEKYALAIEEDLRWLGLGWGEGPGAGGGHGPYAQSERGHIYKEYFDALEAKGLAYPCFCSEHELAISRKTQLAAGHPPRYTGRCRSLSRADVEARFAQGAPATLRFRVGDGATVAFEDKVRGAQSFSTTDIGDFVIRRSDGTPAFFFCNAIDDALMGTTLVVRGEDHLTNTPRQILLLQALGLPLPEYAHIALVVGADGAPLSKRTGSKSVHELRESGFLPLAVNNYLARLGHTYEANTLMSMSELAEHFDLARLGRAPARYDEAQLLHWQHEAIVRASTVALWDWMSQAADSLVPAGERTAFVEAVRANVLFPRDAGEWADRIYSENLPYTSEARNAILGAGSEFFSKAAELLRPQMDFSAYVDSVKATTGAKGKALFQPLRSALTGQIHGPEMPRVFSLIGFQRATQRLGLAQQLLTRHDCT